MKISQIFVPIAFSFGVDFRGFKLSPRALTKRTFLGYQNHLTQYRSRRNSYGKNGGYDIDIPLVLRQGRTVTIFNDGITKNEKLQGFELGLELAAQEFGLT